jgi:serine/threonine-protein kinase RsbW
MGLVTVTRDAMGHAVQSASRTNVRLELASRPEDVSLARVLLRGVAESTQLTQQSTDDICTAVTEASNNVVQHAYDGDPGPIELDLCLRQDALEVSVRDRGAGMRPSIRRAKSDTLGIGLMMMKALSQSVQLRDVPRGGMEVRMRFRAPGLTASDPAEEIPAVATPLDASNQAVSPAASNQAISLTVGPPSLAAAVLPRLLAAIAARADLRTDRISDLQMLGDAIAAGCEPALRGGHLCARIAARPHTVTLSLGPLAPGGAALLLAEASIDGVDDLIERLSDEREIHREGHAEHLVLHVHDCA